MGDRGPMADPHGIRAKARRRKLKVLKGGKGKKAKDFSAGSQAPPKDPPKRPRGSRPSCPKYLTGLARKHFKNIVRWLENRGQLEVSDVGTIISAASAFGEVADLQEWLNEVRELRRKNPRNKTYAEQQIAVLRNLRMAQRALVEFEARLHFNPDARAKRGESIPIGGGQSENPGKSRSDRIMS